MARARQRRRARTEPRAGHWIQPWMGIFIGALIMRLLYLWSIHHAYFLQHLQTEALRYHEWATLILDAPVPPRPPFEQSPGYPYFVAAVYAVLGRTVAAVALVQAVLDAATCAMIAAAGRRWFSQRVGLIAGALAAAYGPMIYFSAELLPATLFMFVAMVALGAALRCRWTLAGVMWALALVIRSEALLAFPLVLLDAWRRGRQHGTLLTLAPLVVVFTAFIGLNAAYSPRLVLLTTSGGINLWLGNNPYADGVNPFPFGPLESIEQSVRARVADAAEWDQTFRGYALAFWQDQPLHAAQLLWKKFLWTWTDRELPNTTDIDWQTAQSWLFRRPVFPLSFGMVLPLAVAGALLLGREWRQLALLLGPIVVGLGSAVIFFTNARFRLIMSPSLLVLAAVAVDRTPGMVQSWRHNRRGLALTSLGIGLGLVAAWGNFYGVRTYQVPQIAVNTGVLEREAGHFDAAVRHLRAGLTGDPHDSIAWIHLALALEQQGHAAASLRAYFDGLALMPDDRQLLEMAARFFQRHGLDPAMLQAYRNADTQAARFLVAQQALHALPDRTEQEE